MIPRHIVLTSNNRVMGIGLNAINQAVAVPESLAMMRGWSPAKIKAYADGRGWKFEWIDSRESPDDT